MTFSWIDLLLIPVGFLAGFINTIAGGGTLLTLPTLLFLGLPPAVANGTNRIAILFQTFAGVKGFQSKGISTYPFSLYLGLSALCGSFIGAYLAIIIDPKLFTKVLAIVMILVLLSLVFTSKKKYQNLIEKTTGKPLYISVILFFFLGIYGGFINAGIGFLMLLILPSLNGLSLVKTNATKVFVVCVYTIGAVLVFVLENKINFTLAFILTIGNTSGAWIASRWSVNKKDSLIRLFLIVTVTALAIKLWFF